jgi:hypothetical protein
MGRDAERVMGAGDGWGLGGRGRGGHRLEWGFSSSSSQGRKDGRRLGVGTWLGGRAETKGTPLRGGGDMTAEQSRYLSRETVGWYGAGFSGTGEEHSNDGRMGPVAGGCITAGGGEGIMPGHEHPRPHLR